MVGVIVRSDREPPRYLPKLVKGKIETFGFADADASIP